jgi:hypothetical protein
VAWCDEDGNDASGGLKQKMENEWGWLVEEFKDYCDITVAEKPADDNDRENDGEAGHGEGNGGGGVPAGLTAGEVFSKVSGGDFDGLWTLSGDPRVLELQQSLQAGNDRLKEFIGFVREAKIDKLIFSVVRSPNEMERKVIALFSNCPGLVTVVFKCDVHEIQGLVVSDYGSSDFISISRRPVRLQVIDDNVVVLSQKDGNRTRDAFDNGCVTCGDFIAAYKKLVTSGSVDISKPIYINLTGSIARKNFFSGCSLSDFIQELCKEEVAATGKWSVCVCKDFWDDVFSSGFASLPVDVRYVRRDGKLPASKGNTKYLILERR